MADQLTIAQRIEIAEAFKARADAYYTATLGPDERVKLNVWSGGVHLRIYFNWESFIQRGGRPHGEEWSGTWAKSDGFDVGGSGRWSHRPAMMKITPTGRLTGKRSRALPGAPRQDHFTGEIAISRPSTPTPEHPIIRIRARIGRRIPVVIECDAETFIMALTGRNGGGVHRGAR